MAGRFRPANGQKGRRAWAAIEKLIAVPDRKIRVHQIERDRDGAGAMRQVPKHQGACTMGRLSNLRQIVPGAGLIINMGHHDNGDIVIDRCGDLITRNGPQLDSSAQQIADALGNIKIGRKIAGLGQDGLEARSQT